METKRYGFERRGKAMERKKKEKKLESFPHNKCHYPVGIVQSA
jgi:hypothetical protein